MEKIVITEQDNGEDHVSISSKEFADRFDRLNPVGKKALVAVMKTVAKGGTLEEAFAAGNLILIENGYEPCVGP